MPYILVDLASDEQAMELVKQLGYTSAPVVVDGAASWADVQPDKIKAVASARATNRYTVPVDPPVDLRLYVYRCVVREETSFVDHRYLPGELEVCAHRLTFGKHAVQEVFEAAV